MKKLIFAAFACVCMSAPASFAGNSTNQAHAIVSAETSAWWHGTYMAADNTNNWIKVSEYDGGYVRVGSNGSHQDYDFQKSTDPYGNLTLTLYNRNGENVGIITYQDGKTLYYNDRKYVKNY